MKLTSYAQNQEDVLLQKAFSGIRKGFYIDVGAFHPTTDSVTNVFYQRGWNGINIEPIKESFDKFIEARPRDINLNIAASAQSGLTKIYFGENLGLASLEQDQQLTEPTMNSQEIMTDTLDNIIEQVPNLTDIHFLKIDVEGHEKAVLMGIDFRKYKPWVLIIESVKESNPLSNLNDWEDLIPIEFYKLVYFDGLNNFYLHFEHLDLEKYFNRLSVIVPGYISASEFELSRKLNEEISKVVSLERNFSLEKKYTSDLIIKISQLETRIAWLQTGQKSQELVETLYHMQERIEYLSQIQANLLEEKDSLYLELIDAVALRDGYFVRLSEIYDRRFWKFVNPFLKVWRQILRVKFALANPGKTLVFFDAKLRRFPNLRRRVIKLIFKFSCIERRLATFRAEGSVQIPKAYTEGVNRYTDLNLSSQFEYLIRNS